MDVPAELQEHVWKNYVRIRTLSELRDANLQFLQGHLRATPYHWGPVLPETVPLLGDLMRINQLGFVSTGGQPALAEHTVYVPESWTDYNGKPTGRWFKLSKQRGYIDGYLPKRLVRAFIVHMEQHADALYYSIAITCTPAQQLFSTFPIRRFNVTAQKTHVNRDLLDKQPWNEFTNIHTDEDDVDNGVYAFEEFPHIVDILQRECVYVTIADRDYGDHGAVQAVLLQFLEAQV